MKKKLKLNKETVTSLNGKQMVGLQGGQVAVTQYPVDCQTDGTCEVCDTNMPGCTQLWYSQFPGLGCYYHSEEGKPC